MIIQLENKCTFVRRITPIMGFYRDFVRRINRQFCSYPAEQKPCFYCSIVTRRLICPDCDILAGILAIKLRYIRNPTAPPMRDEGKAGAWCAN